MRELSPSAHHALLCIFSELFFCEDAQDLERNREHLERILRARAPQDAEAITWVLHRLLTDPDADPSEFASPHQLRDGGAELRRRLALVAPLFDVHAHVRERDVNALRAWLDARRPMSELREHVLVELAELSPEQRGDLVRVALKNYRGIDRTTASTLGEAVQRLASGELAAERFDRVMSYFLRDQS